MIWPQLVVLVLTYPAFLWIVQEPGAWSLLFGFGILSFIGSLPFTAFYAAFTEALRRHPRRRVCDDLRGCDRDIRWYRAARGHLAAALTGDPLAPCCTFCSQRSSDRRHEPDAGDCSGEGRRDLSAQECALFHVAKA